MFCTLHLRCFIYYVRHAISFRKISRIWFICFENFVISECMTKHIMGIQNSFEKLIFFIGVIRRRIDSSSNRMVDQRLKWTLRWNVRPHKPWGQFHTPNFFLQNCRIFLESQKKGLEKKIEKSVFFFFKFSETYHGIFFNFWLNVKPWLKNANQYLTRTRWSMGAIQNVLGLAHAVGEEGKQSQKKRLRKNMNYNIYTSLNIYKISSIYIYLYSQNSRLRRR